MKKLTTCIVICLLLFSVSAMADSISPDDFSATLDIGESVTITKTVTVNEGTPTSSKVDVYFLADETGSMGPYIGAVATAASTILADTAGLGDVAYAVGGYRDIYDTHYSWDYGAYGLHQDMTTDTSLVQAGIDTWYAYGGGDGPEGQMIALTELATTTSWREGSERILVWFGDYEAHDPRDGYTEAGATAALVDNDISVQAISVGADRLDILGQASAIATATDGTFTSGINESSIVATITSAITTAVATYSEVSLDLSAVPTEIGVVADPAAYVGPMDRSSTETYDFDVTFTALPGAVPGTTYDFPIWGTVDKGRVGMEEDHITIVPVPGAFLLGMLGLSVAGIKLRKRA